MSRVIRRGPRGRWGNGDATRAMRAASARRTNGERTGEIILQPFAMNGGRARDEAGKTPAWGRRARARMRLTLTLAYLARSRAASKSNASSSFAPKTAHRVQRGALQVVAADKRTRPALVEVKAFQKNASTYRRRATVGRGAAREFSRSM